MEGICEKHQSRQGGKRIDRDEGRSGPRQRRSISAASGNRMDRDDTRRGLR